MVERCGKEIQKAAELITESIKRGGKVMWCGTGLAPFHRNHRRLKKT
jgi:phosphoheptose isomerase